MKNLEESIEDYRRRFEDACLNIKDFKTLQEVRNLFLSRNRGSLTELFKVLKNLEDNAKPDAGLQINALKQFIQKKLDDLKAELKTVQNQTGDIDDLTLPGKSLYWGGAHPIRLIQQKVENVFFKMGFFLEEGPEIESEYYNFDALNFPANHPARGIWETFYIRDDLLLRTHTSPVLIRAIEKKKPPIRVLATGKVYRRETTGPLQLPMLHQLTGMVVDHGITFAHLKGMLEYFIKSIFSEKILIRFRPGYLPFAELATEVDIKCKPCGGEDSNCHFCRGRGYFTIMGAGMVDPQVFKNVNIDPERFTGFIFGLNIDRITSFTYEIPDMRFLYENDIRFIRQFS